MKLRTVLIPAILLVFAANVQAVLIGFNPSAATVTTGEFFDVDVIVSGLDADGEIVSAYDLDVIFDDTALQVNIITFSLALGDIGLGEATIDASLPFPGILNFASVSLISDAALDVLQGDVIILATIGLTALVDGVATFDIGPSSFLVGRNGQDITPAASVPEPTTLGLLGAGLLGLVFVRRRRAA